VEWGAALGTVLHDERELEASPPDLEARFDHLERLLFHMRDRVDSQLSQLSDRVDASLQGMVRVQKERHASSLNLFNGLKDECEMLLCAFPASLSAESRSLVCLLVSEEVGSLQKAAAAASQRVQSQFDEHVAVFKAALKERDVEFQAFAAGLEGSHTTFTQELEKALRWRDDRVRTLEGKADTFECKLQGLQGQCAAFQVRDFTPFIDLLDDMRKWENSRPSKRGLLQELDQVQSMAMDIRSMQTTLDSFSQSMFFTTSTIDEKFTTLRKDIGETFRDVQARVYHLEDSAKLGASGSCPAGAAASRIDAFEKRLDQLSAAAARENERWALASEVNDVRERCTMMLESKLDGPKCNEMVSALLAATLPKVMTSGAETIARDILGAILPRLEALETRPPPEADVEWAEG
jgi:hypothetical protein